MVLYHCRADLTKLLSYFKYCQSKLNLYPIVLRKLEKNTNENGVGNNVFYFCAMFFYLSRKEISIFLVSYNFFPSNAFKKGQSNIFWFDKKVRNGKER